MYIDDFIVNYIVLFLMLELFEIYWQKASTLMGMLARMYHYYAKNIFLFLFLHPTFYFAVSFAILSNYATGAVLLLLLKTADITAKLLLINQIFIKKEVSHEMGLMLLAPIHQALPYIGLIIYPILIYLTF